MKNETYEERMKTQPFTFGKNWRKYLEGFSPERLAIAKTSLTNYLGDIKGKTFIDIGAGSGLYSYAAYELGASRVMSVDIDPDAVICCKQLRNIAGDPDNWEIRTMSILDEKIFELGTFDIVHSWGVLHHTGNMKQAIVNAMKLVSPGGIFYIAIYNRVRGILGSRFWRETKKVYNRSPLPLRYVMEGGWAVYLIGNYLALGTNPIKAIRGLEAKRGMSWRRDLTDWMGGYPYEYAAPEEIIELVQGKDHAFRLEKLRTGAGLGNNKYVFSRQK